MDQHAITETTVDPQMVEEILRFFRQILRSEEPLVDEATSFFVLGGSSLQAVALAGCLQQLFDVEITALSIVDHPTPAALARHITALRVGASAEQDEEEGLL